LDLFGFETRNQFAAKLPQIILNGIRNQIGNCQVLRLQVNNYWPFRQISLIPAARDLRIVICCLWQSPKCRMSGNPYLSGASSPIYSGICRIPWLCGIS